jgi:T-complex protein 1 subunit delta
MFVCPILLQLKVVFLSFSCLFSHVWFLAVADAIRTSLGPRGMDKMIQKGDGEVLITNDGATILSQLQVFHPTAQMLVQLSKSQDIEAGDGTTGICVIAGALLQACSDLLAKGIHPTMIADSFKQAAAKAEEIFIGMSIPVDLLDRDSVLDAVNTCLSSKVVHNNADVLAPIAVDAVLSVIDPATATNVDLRDIKMVKQVGGTIDDTELVKGLVLEHGAKHTAGGPSKIENAKIALIQFCLSAPKTDMENNVVVSDYAAMDRILREERKFILNQCKKIKKWGVNVLLIQKSILRDAYNDLALHYLAKLDIMVVTDIERTDVDFISRTLKLQPIAHIDHCSEDKLGSAGLVQEVTIAGSTSKVVKFTDIVNMGRTITVLMRGTNHLVIDEADRSLHDALCVVRSLVKKRFLISGGGSPEAECALKITQWSKTLTGVASYCARAFAEALEIIPYTLAENAGMNAISIVTELRNRHNSGSASSGINVKNGTISDMWQEKIVQPLLVNTSEIALATECVGKYLFLFCCCDVCNSFVFFRFLACSLLSLSFFSFRNDLKD